MGKKREKVSPDSSNSNLLESTLDMHSTGSQDGPPNKKSKKHKRKKSSKKDKYQEKLATPVKQVELVETLMMEDDDQEIHIDDVEMDADDSLSESASGNKLMIKTPDVPGDKNIKLMPKTKSDKSKSSGGSSKKSSKKKEGGKGDDDTDSEEERWLDAIESGKLEEVDDELKRIKNPRLMTARQRALMEKRSDGVDEGYAAIPAEPLLALPTGFKEKVMTEEMIAKKAIKSKRRREQAIEKREEDKKKTVDRLLKKQDAKVSKSSRSKCLKKDVPLISYLDNSDGILISFPVGMDVPALGVYVERNPRKPSVCESEGCSNLKKYACSKTGVNLCSLECYKKNLDKWFTSGT